MDSASPTPIARRTFAGPLLHPLAALLLAVPIGLFAMALATDIAYLSTAEMQWSNFSAWLIAAAVAIGMPVLLGGIVTAVRARLSSRRGRVALYLLLVAIMWVCGLVNAFQHSRDAWSSVGAVGLILSIVSFVAATGAGWIGYSAGPETTR